MSKLSQPSVTQPSSSSQAEYSLEERQILLSLAHQAILSALNDKPLPPASYSSHLSGMRGVFTTLYLHENLRGCVGYVLPVAPLYRAVAETASAAAFDDSRFWPVTAQEGPLLKVSLSVLSRLTPIHPEEVEVGRHGLIVSRGIHRGLLLPQVALEHDWNRETFLEQTCNKAGLPSDAWHKGATLEAFTAEIFSDSDIPPSTGLTPPL